MPRRLPLAVAVVLLAVASPVHADDAVFPLEPPDTSSPFDTYRTFVAGCDEIYEWIERRQGLVSRDKDRRLLDVVERTFRCLDMTGEAEFLKEYRAGEATVCLKEILDRLPPIEASSIPGGPGWGDDELPERWVVPQTTLTIARVADGPRAGEYLFTQETVANAVSFYDRVEHLPYVRTRPSKGFHNWFVSMPRQAWLAKLVLALPDWFLFRVLGQAVWQWIGLFLLLSLAIAVVFVVYRIAGQKTAEFRGQNLFRYWVTLWAPVVVFLVPIGVNSLLRDHLVISGTTLLTVRFVMDLCILFALVALVLGVNVRIIETIVSSRRMKPRGLDEQLVRLVGRLLGLVVAVIVFLEGGQYLGIPLTTLLAGAGVGGVALALAAQDMLKNLFGSLMILFDKPFRLGERIVAHGYDGVVEEIGLRSTRIRTLTGHQVTIPNEQMARVDIENIGRRPHIRRHTNLRLPIDTSPEKADEAVAIVRGILEDHVGQAPDFPPRVFLDEFNEDSLNLKVLYWYHPPNYWDFLALSQQVNLEIKERFAAAGIEFALPSSTMHIERGDVDVAGERPV